MKKNKIVLDEYRDRAWKKLFKAIENIEKLGKEALAKGEISKKDYQKYLIAIKAEEAKIKALDRIIQRTDPLKFQSSLSYEHVLKLVHTDEKPAIEGQAIPEIEVTEAEVSETVEIGNNGNNNYEEEIDE